MLANGLYRIPVRRGTYKKSTLPPPSATNMGDDVPLVEYWLKCFRRGGNENGNAYRVSLFCRPRFLLPAALIGFIAAHVYLFRKAGAAGPPSEYPVHPLCLPTERFYPRQVVMDTIVALVMILVQNIITSATILFITTGRG